MHKFELTSSYRPTGDQPEAISQLVSDLRKGNEAEVLLGVTGSGKTFTIANVIQQLQRPALILSHNKTLAAQLYSEFKGFFPNNRVEYFVSYYDYYQPEAYIPSTDTYIEKDLAINDEIDRLRLSTVSSLLSGRRDVVVISSVSCIYGMGNPDSFDANLISLKKGAHYVRDTFLLDLVNAQYVRNEMELNRGNFRVKGDTVDVFLANEDFALRVVFWGDEIDELLTVNPVSGSEIDSFDEFHIYPASIFVTSKEGIHLAIDNIRNDLNLRVAEFEKEGRGFEAKRLTERVNYDIEMILELGYCQGIENYSRYFDGRSPGTRPFCLLDFFPKDYLLVIDESHVTIPQIQAMYGGDKSRKANLIEYGFRLPAAADNRPLKFEEFTALQPQTIYVSATPADYELQKTGGEFVEQVIRPTGLLDPVIEIRPSLNQIDDLMEEIEQRREKNQRSLVTTLTKRMAEELTSYLLDHGIRVNYIHSDVDTMERVQILDSLRKGQIDVLVGVNLLREGLDLPEVSLVAILDADKEGFLRSHRSLTQTAGRAARNVEGTVIMYADTITESMRLTIDETNRRREKQLRYNDEHHITPQPLNKAVQTPYVFIRKDALAYSEPEHPTIAADPVVQYMNTSQLAKAIEKTRKAMLGAAKDLDFITAAQLRDEMQRLQERLARISQDSPS